MQRMLILELPDRNRKFPNKDRSLGDPIYERRAALFLCNARRRGRPHAKDDGTAQTQWTKDGGIARIGVEVHAPLHDVHNMSLTRE